VAIPLNCHPRAGVNAALWGYYAGDAAATRSHRRRPPVGHVGVLVWVPAGVDGWGAAGRARILT
jgi:hypothetical protein